MGGDGASKKKKKRRDRKEASGAAAAAAGGGATSATDAGADAGAAAAAAAAGALAEGTGKKSKKSKRKRQRPLEGGRDGAIDAGPGATSCTGDGDTEPRTASGTKRRKKEGGRQPQPAEGVDATAAVSPEPPSLACTTKAAEYAAVDAGGKGAPSAGRGASSKTSNEKKKKKKPKKDKRVKTGRATSSSPSHATHTPTPPLLPGRAGQTKASKENQDADADSSSNSSSNNNNDDDGDHDDNGHGDDGQGPVLEGIFHEGAMYLVDAGGKAFSAQRDERGDLVEVGTYDKDRGRVAVVVVVEADRPARLPAAGAPSTPESAEAGAGVACSADKRETKGKGKGKGKKDGSRVEDAPEKETGPAVVDYPFEVEECDHCETSERAYADIAPLLSALAAELGKTPEELVIYDPYYCQGSTVARLASLGFPRAYNRKEDFYEVVKNGTVPEHDVVVTNPPFSGEHVPKILSFCAREGARPWFLLLPNYVYLKDYYESSLGRGGPGRSAALPFYLTPPKRYMYYSPAGSRLKVKSSERKTSPFNTFWYIRLGDGGITSKILQSYDAVSRKTEAESRCCVARTTQQIPYKMMDSNDPRRKKARDRQRSIDRIRKKKSEWVVS